MNLDGILPSSGVETKEDKPKLPTFIPKDAVWPIASEDDVDDFPRGAIAHLTAWDDDVALDLLVAGASIILVDRATHTELSSHDDFDPDGFGVLDDAGLWLPGLDAPYAAEAEGWREPPPA